MSTDLDMATHLHPEGQGALPLAGNSLPLFSIFSGSPALGWVFWPLWFTWGTSTLLSLELLCLTTSPLCEQRSLDRIMSRPLLFYPSLSK